MDFFGDALATFLGEVFGPIVLRGIGIALFYTLGFPFATLRYFFYNHNKRKYIFFFKNFYGLNIGITFILVYCYFEAAYWITCWTVNW